MRRSTAFTLAILAALSAGSGPATAETLQQLIPDLLARHPRLAAYEQAHQAAVEGVEVARGAWYPTVTTTANYGHEQQNKPHGTADTRAAFKEGDIVLKQLLWDFGAAGATVDVAKLRADQAGTQYDAIRQSLIGEGVSAYIMLAKAHRVLAFARRSEDNIRQQTGMEEVRVQRGSGLSTDVLQAKAALAEAQAVRVNAEGEMEKALNSYRKVFERVPTDLDALVIPPMPQLPATLAEAVKLAVANNPTLKGSRIGEEVARGSYQATKATVYYPKIDSTASFKNKTDVDGTMGNQKEYVAKVEISFPFNLGFTAVNTLKAAEYQVGSATATMRDTERTLDESVRNAWREIETKRSVLDYYRNKAGLAEEFLILARKERELGNRTLLDVLAGETELIGAQRNAAAAEGDLVYTAYALMALIGQLDAQTFQ